MVSFRNALRFLSPGGILFLSSVFAVPRSNTVKRDNREEFNATNMVAVNGADNYWCVHKFFVFNDSILTLGNIFHLSSLIVPK